MSKVKIVSPVVLWLRKEALQSPYFPDKVSTPPSWPKRDSNVLPNSAQAHDSSSARCRKERMAVQQTVNKLSSAEESAVALARPGPWS